MQQLVSGCLSAQNCQVANGQQTCSSMFKLVVSAVTEEPESVFHDADMQHNSCCILASVALITVRPSLLLFSRRHSTINTLPKAMLALF